MLLKLIRGRCFCLIVVVIICTVWAVSSITSFLSLLSGKTHKDRSLRQVSPPYPDDGKSNIFWFVQVSDSHFSKWERKERASDLLKFCRRDLGMIIKPQLVLMTGDITDSKDKHKWASVQHREEWEMYSSVLRKCDILQKTRWIDLKGNHDGSYASSLHPGKELYRLYSASGGLEECQSASCRFVHNTSYGVYSFNTINGVPDPMAKRPFSFFGSIYEDGMHLIQKQADASKSSNMTIWIGHYPLSTLIAPRPGIRYLIRDGIAYLCGHLHTLLNSVTEMYTINHRDQLELELGDWKDNRIYRIMAIDHDLLSLTDTKFGKWPLIVITNPKNAKLSSPVHEPLRRILHSTHIRMLVFSISSITKVSVEIDGRIIKHHVRHIDGPLYAAKWNPRQYSKGIHTICVNATDSTGHSGSIFQTFSVDGSRPPLSVIPSLVLLLNGTVLVRMFFMIAVIVVVMPLLYFRSMTSPFIDPSVFHSSSLIRPLACLAHIDRVYYPIICLELYIVFGGPWFIGYLLEDNIGFVNVYGLYMQGRFIYDNFTYIQGAFMLFHFLLPMQICLAMLMDRRNFSNFFRTRSTSIISNIFTHIKRNVTFIIHHKLFLYIIIVVAFVLRLQYCLTLYRTYGLMATVISPVNTWPLLLFLYLIFKIRKMEYSNNTFSYLAE